MTSMHYFLGVVGGSSKVWNGDQKLGVGDGVSCLLFSVVVWSDDSLVFH